MNIIDYVGNVGKNKADKMNFPLWDRLNNYADDLSKRFDTSFVRYDNPKYTENMKFEGWTDTFWESETVGKCHLKTIQPKDAKSLWLMHINIFPKEGIELPILGFDIVSGPKKITGSFMDFSPLHGYEHPYNEYMKQAILGLEWVKPRELPDWAKEIFSVDMMAAGSVRPGEELDQLCETALKLTSFYLESSSIVPYKTKIDTTAAQNK